MSDNLKYIPKLNGDNYGIWKVRMKALLINKDLWEFVKLLPVSRSEPQDERSIVSAGSDAATASVSGPQAHEEGAGFKRQVNGSQMALSLIIL